MKYLKSIAVLIIAVAASLVFTSPAEAGKWARQARMQAAPCSGGQCYRTPQAGMRYYYTTGQGATYAPPAIPQPTPAVTPAPVVQPDAPGRVLATPVSYQPAEMKPAEPGMNAVPVEAAPSQPVYYSDPYGFTDWLNGVRAQYGLGAVGHDPNLSSWAARNNDSQNAYGMGHHVMGPARRQNSGMGASSAVWPMWMASGAHRAALLDPSISWIGIAASGAYWTFNAN